MCFPSNKNDTPRQDFKLNLGSLNVRGLHDVIKRKRVFQWFRESDLDILCLQETFCTSDFIRKFNIDWNGYIYHAPSPSNHSKGVCILVKKHFNIEYHSQFKDVDGRKLLINISINNELFTIVNIYAPTSNENNKIEFFKRVAKWVKQHSISDNFIILCGDFNCVEYSNDRTSGNIDRSSKAFKDMKNYIGLKDTYSNLELTAPLDIVSSTDTLSKFTWIDPSDSSRRSRIDYILATPQLFNLATFNHTKIAPVPDHKAVVTTFSHLGRKRGRGYFKLNTDLLKDQCYKDGVNKIFDDTYSEYLQTLDKRNLWELIKIRIKEFSIKVSVEKAKIRKHNMTLLENSILDLDKQILQNPTNFDNLKTERETKKRELDKLFEYKARGYQIRSRSKWVEEGEKSTSYFLRLEKRHQNFNKIDALKTHDDSIVRTDPEILDECVKFYSKLYSTTNPNPTKINDYLDATFFPSILSDDDKNLCEGLITNEECLYALKNLKLNKSPGLDGLPSEFYREFWPLIGNLVIDSFNESFVKGQLSESQRNSVLSLIFKKNDRTSLKYYRPISLATVDYRLLAFILVNRLHKVISKLVSPEQTGYIKKRFIGCNIRLVEDLIEYTDRLNIGGAIIFLDFEKAFDSVEWQFMFKTLSKFNFGQGFIKWVQTLYNNPTARVKNNGWLSKSFTLNRGIRQGCPLSALLFILVVEVLALRINQNRNIKGFTLSDPKLGSKELKNVQYADDSILILKSKESIQPSIKEIQEFSTVSGLNLNLDKTEGLWLGRDKNNENLYQGINFGKQVIRCLGIFVGHDKEQCHLQNWVNKLEKFQKTLDCWRTRDLTLFGKILVIKVLALSQLVYSAICLTCPEEVKKQITKIIYSFLWNKRDRIKRAVLTNTLENGGLNMIDIGGFFDSLKISWIKRIIDGPINSWNFLPRKYLNKYGNDWLILHTSAVNDLFHENIQNIPDFYKSMIVAFNRSKSVEEPTCTAQLEDHVIWGNLLFTYSHKRSVNKTLYFRTWIESGILKIKNLKFKINGNLDETFLYNKISNKTNILSEIYILNKCLQRYRHLLHGCSYDENSNLGDLSVITNISCSKPLYHAIIKKKVKPLSLNKWETKLNIPNNSLNISDIMRRKVITVEDKKIAEFNYKVLNNILVNSYLLSKWKTEVSPNCELCGEHNDTLHMLYFCDLAQNVWAKLSRNKGTAIDASDVIFGRNSQFDQHLNFLISIIAFNIYKFWLIAHNENKPRTQESLYIQLISDLSLRVSVLQKLKKENLAVYVNDFLNIL